MTPATAAERKRKSRANLSEEQKLKEREKAKSHMRELRLKRKNERKWKRKKENDASKLTSKRKMRAEKNLQTSLVMPSENPFKNPQSFGKALKPTRTALPQSPRNKLAVVKKMAKDLGIPIAKIKGHSMEI